MVIAIQRQPLAMYESYSPIPKHLISKAFGKFLVAIRSWLMSELEFVRSEIRRRFRINYSAACSAVPYTMCGLDGQSTVEENVSWRDSESGQDAPRLSVPGFAWLLRNILRLQRRHPVWASTTLDGALIL